jgi:hypothetical protein
MAQQVFADAYGMDCWSRDHHDRCFVHLSNSLAWKAITGQDVPTMPFTAADYSRRGYPWYEAYSEMPSLSGTTHTKALKSVVSMDASSGGPPIVLDNESAHIKLHQVMKVVRDGKWG